jgi:hypothetical protein
MAPDDKNEAATQVEPPKVYFAACGVLCDIFWWARREPASEAQPLPPAKSKAP